MEKPDPEVDVFVDLQLSDLVRANLWFTYNKRGMKFSVVTSFLTFLVFGGLLLLADVPAWFVFIPLGLLLLLGTTPLIILVETRRNFAAVKEFQKHVHYVFGSAGYEASDGKSSSHVSWESIQKAVESKHSFNLFISLRLFVVIPKRCLKTSDELLGLRSILREALGEKATMNAATN